MNLISLLLCSLLVFSVFAADSSESRRVNGVYDDIWNQAKSLEKKVETKLTEGLKNVKIEASTVVSGFSKSDQCPKMKDFKYCPFYSFYNLAWAVNSPGKTYTGKELGFRSDVNCDQSVVVNHDGMLLCSGSPTSFAELGVDFSNNVNRVLSFSATINSGDFVADLDSFPVKNNEKGIGMTTHRGFNGKFTQFKPTLDKWFDCEDKRTVIVQGFSMGGAIAHIAGLYLAGKGCTVEIVTQGEPASFKKPFSAIANSVKHTRYVHYKENSCSTSGSVNFKDPMVDISSAVGYSHPESSKEISLVSHVDCEGAYVFDRNIPRKYKSGSDSVIGFKSVHLCYGEVGINILCPSV